MTARRVNAPRCGIVLLLLLSVSLYFVPSPNVSVLHAAESGPSPYESETFEDEDPVCSAGEEFDAPVSARRRFSPHCFYKSPLLPVPVRPPEFSL